MTRGFALIVLVACGGHLERRAAAAEPPPAESRADTICDDATGAVFDAWEEATLAHRADDAQAAADRLHELLPKCIALETARLPKGWTAASLRATDVPAALAIARARAVQLALAPLAGLSQLPELRALLERCAALRPGFHDADAELLLGTLAANLSTFTHGPDGSDWFAKARERAGEGVLLVDVQRARALDVAHRDRAAFDATLTAVVNADLSRWPQHQRANELAVRKARRYLAHADELFTAPFRRGG